MPMPLWVAAPIRPAVWVPCQELSCTSQSPNAAGLAVLSASLIQSPGSDGSASRPSPSFEVSTSEIMS
jgi:hypothetical protein